MCDTPFKSVRVNNVLCTLPLWTSVSLHVSLELSDACCYSDSLPPWHSLALRCHSNSTMNVNHSSVYKPPYTMCDWGLQPGPSVGIHLIEKLSLWQLYQSWQKLECRHIFYFKTFHFQTNKKTKTDLNLICMMWPKKTLWAFSMGTILSQPGVGTLSGSSICPPSDERSHIMIN